MSAECVVASLRVFESRVCGVVGSAAFGCLCCGCSFTRLVVLWAVIAKRQPHSRLRALFVLCGICVLVFDVVHLIVLHVQSAVHAEVQVEIIVKEDDEEDLGMCI